MSFEPVQKILWVAADGARQLSADEITEDSVGEKAFGLACLPSTWTLPFIVVSSALAKAYREIAAEDRVPLVQTWATYAQSAATEAGIPPTGPILIRSSATDESLDDRGRFHSTSGELNHLVPALIACLERIGADSDLDRSRVHLVVQRAATPVSGKGHLSNERRCYEEARDWIGEFEGPEHADQEVFSINLRNWRQSEESKKAPSALICNLRAHVSTVLRVVARWGYKHGVRVHFEWVWDGQRLWIVQADRAGKSAGIDPLADPDFARRGIAKHEPTLLAHIDKDHARKYNKIKNVYTYLKLQLPITDLYILDNPRVLEGIRLGNSDETLTKDFEALTTGSLVIRTDLATDDHEKRQLLPRTEVRDAKSAIAFLKSTLSALHDNGVNEQIAFLCHNFIPAVSSAFAYAAPGQRKVWIETLWGLPEGLYYNAHDKIEVDTQHSQISKIAKDDLEQFAIRKRPRFKRFFVAPDSQGNWIMKQVSEPWDWRLSIRKDEWIRQIAYNSRRIAEEENRSVSIMWFVGVPKWASPTPVFPWYHEAFDLAHIERPRSSRRKTPFDQSFIIRTRKDIEKLEHEADIPNSRVRQIRIQPGEDALLRNKELLRTIGDLAKQLDAVILLEGGTLSHAYYQLLQTKAIVEVMHPFDVPEEKREFNKLVRDDIPQKITLGGETVRIARLTGDSLLRALKEKLVEEAYEALEAGSQESILEELSDIEEVVDGVLKQLKVDRAELNRIKQKKLAKAGGFAQGYILVETNNPSPDKAVNDSHTLPLALSETQDVFFAEDARPPAARPIIGKWADRREHPAASEKLLNIVVSLTRDKWVADSQEMSLGGPDDDIIRARIRGIRKGPNLHLELSLYMSPKQLNLLN